jgi:hypothetical protein
VLQPPQPGCDFDLAALGVVEEGVSVGCGQECLPDVLGSALSCRVYSSTHSCTRLHNCDFVYPCKPFGYVTSTSRCAVAQRYAAMPR